MSVMICGAFSPGRVFAGCGEYNHEPENSPQIAQFLKSHSKSPVIPVCQGPHCKQQPVSESPMREAPTRLISAEKQIVDELIKPYFLVASFVVVACEHDDLAPDHFSKTIYHPPR